MQNEMSIGFWKNPPSYTSTIEVVFIIHVGCVNLTDGGPIVLLFGVFCIFCREPPNQKIIGKGGSM